MKSYLPTAAVILAVLNVLLVLPSTSAYTVPIASISLILALIVAALAILGKPKAEVIPEKVEVVPAPAPAPVMPVQPPAPVTNQAEAEIAAFVALFQEKGRFVDFLMEELTAYEDVEVGAAARVVHQGCRQVLQEHFKITPVSDAVEGTQVTIPTGYASDEYRLIGKLSGDPPFVGTLIHKGWKTESVKLPRLVSTLGKRLPAIAPAEVELK
jgi:uncharacterized protein DUF2760